MPGNLPDLEREARLEMDRLVNSRLRGSKEFSRNSLLKENGDCEPYDGPRPADDNPRDPWASITIP